MKPMKLTDVGSSDAEVEPYLIDPAWIMQQKHDGARVVMVYNRGSDDQPTYYNGSGGELSFSAAKLLLPALTAHLLADFAALGIHAITLDGELIIETGVFHVFDTLYARVDSSRVGPEENTVLIDGLEPLSVRMAQQFRHFYDLQGSLVRYAVTARTEADKRALWAEVNRLNVEGAISKRLDSLYEPGTRTKAWVKHKLVKTADVVVTRVERKFDHKGMVTHGTAELAVPIQQHEDPAPFVNARGRRAAGVVGYFPYEESGPKGFEFNPRTLLPVGNASLIGKELTIGAGSVVEVAYLNFQSAMIQPRILRQRFDKLVAECELSQFPEYTREVATLGDSAAVHDPADDAVEAFTQELMTDLDRVEEVGTAPDDGPRTGRGPSGKLRNFDAMGDSKFAVEAAKIEAENNDPEALEAVRASRAGRAL